ncbi:phosphomannomutase (plasmid) [Ensifer sp. WSM1721]|uniref:phosphomannomutase n=1 Tax=Ensifer sp. WSM1721 TaxID=1041159 RepID=UPI00047D1951|nr:phosphomannomutase [Ensifer sp. WSM1721]
MKFGTSGLRGLSADLVETGSVIYATAFGRYLLESGKARPGDAIIIGRDCRESSPTIEAICRSALAALGFKIFECGTVPTPALAHYALKLRSASMMITGSHIPADRNGIKFYLSDGEIGKAEEAAITALATSIATANDLSVDGGKQAEDHSQRCVDLFLKRNSNLLSDEALSGLIIGVYEHSTVARDLITALLVRYGARVISLGRSETFVPLDTEAVPEETVARFNSWATLHDLDAIVSADGDGDRPLIADEKGNPLRGDLVGLMTAQFLNAKSIVTPVTSNSGIEALGFHVTRTQVGSPFVIAAMREAIAAGGDSLVGFEANGGVLTSQAFYIRGVCLEALPTRDSILPILAVLSLLSAQKKPLSAIAGSYKLAAAAAARLPNFPAHVSASLMTYLRACRANLSDFLREIGQVAATSDIDGLRIELTDKRIVHLRPSGNAPEMRCYVEANTEIAANELLKAGLSRLSLWNERKAPGQA